MIKKILHQWSPPCLWEWGRKRASHIWHVPDWPETQAGGWTGAAEAAAAGFDEGLSRMRDGQAMAHLPSEEPGAWLDSDPTFHHRMVQFGLVAARTSGVRGSLNVLDYGGGFGVHAHALKRLMPWLELQYTVCELPSFCEIGRQLNPDVRFVSSLTEAGNGYDLVYASSSVQYTRDWKDLLAELIAASAGGLFITRTPFVVQGESFVIMQRAYGTEYPGWVFNKDEFVEAARQLGSKNLQEVFVNGRGLAVRGAPQPNLHLGLLFA